MNPSCEPTDRSMLRDTMISTMPVAMMAIETLCTDRFQRLRAVRKSPPDRMLKPSQMPARATTMPNMRVSTSVDATSPRHVERVDGGLTVVVSTSAVMMPSTPRLRPAPSRWRRTQAHRGVRVVSRPWSPAPVSAGAVSAGAVSAGAVSAGVRRRRTRCGVAHRDRPGLDALAQRRLVDHPRVEDDVEVVAGDRLEDRRISTSARCRPAT